MPVHISLHHQYNHQRRRRRRKAEAAAVDNDKDDPTKTNQDEKNVGSKKTSLLDKYSSLRIILIVLVLATTTTVTKASAQQKAYHQPAIDNTIYDELVQLSRNRTLNIYSPPSQSSSSSSSNSEYDYSQILQYSADNNGYNYNYVSSGNNGDLIYYPSGDMVGNNNNKSTRNANSGGVCVGDVCTDGIFKWHRSKVKNIYVGGIFPMMGGWPGGQACLPSAIMALNEVNLNASILPNYRINLNWFNSECTPGKGISNLYEMIFHKEKNQDDIIMLLGPGCSDVSSSVAEVANYWNLTVLSFGSSSPALSNRARFKTFYRTHPSAILDNPARLKLCELYKWKKIATIQDNQEVFTSTVDNLEKEAKTFNISIIARQTFTTDPTYAVKNLKKQDARIIVGVFYEKEARKVFCQAYKEGMIFPKYIWMIIGWYSANWYLEVDDEISCNRTEMEIAVYGHLTTEVQFLSNKIHEKVDYGLSVVEYDENFRKFVSSAKWKDFSRRFPKVDYKYRQSSLSSSSINRHSSLIRSALATSSVEENKTFFDFYEKIEDENSEEIEKLGGHLERALAYDAVWVLAYSLNLTLSRFGTLEKFNISNYAISNYVKEAMKRTNFKGISGLVMFDEQGDRISEVLYEQLQNHSGVLGYVKLGTHFKTKFDCCMNITWGKSKHPPTDGIKTYEIPKTIKPFNTKFFYFLSFASVIVGALCLLFNYRFKTRKIIKYSEPEINNMLIVGCFLCLLSVFIFGYDKSSHKATVFNGFCQVGISTLMLGFTIGYGSLFSKIWFVYTASIEKKRNNNYTTPPPKKIKFYAVIIVLVVIDLIILTVWMLHDPLKETTLKLPNEAEINDDIINLPVIRVCKCNHEYIWIGVCFSIKGIVLIMGLFLSYETRNSKIEWVNDSKFIALSIYNIVVLTLITAPVTLIIQNQHQLDASFSFIAFAINICSLLTLALIFIPKIKHVIRHKVEEDLSDPCVNKQTIDQKKEKYFKLKKENEDLNEIISKREEMLLRLERILNPNFAMKKAESVRFEFNRRSKTYDNSNSTKIAANNVNNKNEKKSFGGDDSSCSNTGITPLNVYNFDIQSEYSTTTKIQTNETEF